MAAISAILGGILGFWLALTGLMLFDLSLLQALGLWSGTGLATLAGMLVLARLPRVATLVRA